jgi:hypothetical protein
MSHLELLKLQKKLESEAVKTIQCVFVYLDSPQKDKDGNDEFSIVSTKTEMISILNNELSKDLIFDLVAKYKCLADKKYIYHDSFCFLMDLDSESILEYLEDNEEFYDITTDFLHPVSLVESIFVPDSIKIFHDLNQLYFVFSQPQPKQHSTIKKHPIMPKRTRKKNSVLTKSVV